MTLTQGNGSSARGRAWDAGLAGEHLPAQQWVAVPGAASSPPLCTMEDAGNEVFQEGEISLSARVSFSNL